MSSLEGELREVPVSCVSQAVASRALQHTHKTLGRDADGESQALQAVSMQGGRGFS